MYILGIETTGAFASVALVRDGVTVQEIHGSDRFSHLQNLMPQVEKVLKDSGSTLDDVDLIAVSAGPGSFTGIRIGVSSARALSQITGIPCVAVSSLESLALNAADTAAEETLICPMLDARRQQIYGGGYFIRDGRPVEEVKAGPYTVEEFLEIVSGYENIMMLGDGIDKYGDLIEELRPRGTETAPESIRYQDAVSAAKTGAAVFAEKGGLTYDQVEPEYMRIPEAERKLREKQAQERSNEKV